MVGIATHYIAYKYSSGDIFAGGASGAPLVQENGSNVHIVGMHFAGDGNLGFAVARTTLDEFVQELLRRVQSAR